MTRFGAVDAERAIADDGIEPAARGSALRIESGRAAPDPHKGIVYGFLGQILP